MQRYHHLGRSKSGEAPISLNKSATERFPVSAGGALQDFELRDLRRGVAGSTLKIAPDPHRYRGHSQRVKIATTLQ